MGFFKQLLMSKCVVFDNFLINFWVCVHFNEWFMTFKLQYKMKGFHVHEMCILLNYKPKNLTFGYLSDYFCSISIKK